MSQRAGTMSYHIFAGGLSLVLYALFYIACDVWGWQLAMFRTLGTNALVGYILHGIVDNAVSPFIPKDAPGWYVTLGFLLYFFITWLFIRHLEKSNIYLKL
jgi:fucose 4-O-acetylase-like acetyltransferase